MLNEMIDRLVLGKRYQLQEIYELMKDYCIQNSIDDWKHKIRAQLEEKKVQEHLESTRLHIMVIALIQLSRKGW